MQTNQKPTFSAHQRSSESEALLVRLHEVENVSQLAKATFQLVGSVVPNQFLILLFRPLEFELPCRFQPLKYKDVVDRYQAENHKHDLWLERSPVNPQVTVVRHSDFTPNKMLRRSAYYRTVLRPLDSEFGASVVAWRETTWLATLSVMRSDEQGDFTDEHMRELQAIQPHFACVIRRLARYQETRLIQSSLRHVMSYVPTATVVLDWNLKVLHYNAVASELCTLWKSGERASFLKEPRRILVPGDILAELERMRPGILAPKTDGGQARSASLVYNHPTRPGLSAIIEFLPSRSLALSRGTFLVTLKEQAVVERKLSFSERLAQLTRRERECALLAAEGLHNRDIARKLGKSEITVRNQLSSIYRKLGIASRHRLIAGVAGQAETSDD